MEQIRAAILGSGNIGTDLMYKLKRSHSLRPTIMAGIIPESEGLARARQQGLAITTDGIEGLLKQKDSFELVFDATTASAHKQHAPMLRAAGKIAIDLTPAAVGPYVVPLVNLEEHVGEPNVNLVSCGGQATVPLVSAMRSASPVEPPILMRNTIYGIVEESDPEELRKSIEAMVARIQEYVPGYRLRAKPLIEDFPARQQKKVTLYVEVEGAGDYLPQYAGNLDIMTSAAIKVGEEIGKHLRAGTWKRDRSEARL